MNLAHKAEYGRQYYLRNREKIAEYGRQYYTKNSEKFTQRRRRFALANPEKSAEYQRQYRAKNPERVAKRSWQRQGLPEPTRPCPEFCERVGCVRKAIALDHCHDTGAFRGWLCVPCNTAIGSLGDNIEGLKKAINYLEKSCAI